MRWSDRELNVEQEGVLPGLARLNNFVRSVRTPEFVGMTFHEVLAKSALNHVPSSSPRMANAWTINPYRGCSHACVYCFARPTHEYLDLDPGRDFDAEVIVKVNVVEVLEKELARPTWQREPVMLGTNTDPYQRAEGRYRLMPGVIAALAANGTPLSILTKGTLLRRDLPLLQAAAERVPVSLAMSIAVYDPELQQSVEPGTPTTAARLETVRAATEAGFEVAVFLMPVLPYLTDTTSHLDRALEMAASAGAVEVVYTALHLRGPVKQWYFDWLQRTRPDLLPRYAELYARGAYAPKEYREWLARRIRPLLRKHGLDRRRTTAQVRGRTRGSALAPTTENDGLLAAELSPEAAALLQPTLF